MKSVSTIILLGLFLGACAYRDGSRNIDPALGSAVIANMEAQAVSPTPATAEPTTDGTRAALAIRRHKENTTPRPQATRTAQVAAAGGGSGTGAPR